MFKDIFKSNAAQHNNGSESAGNEEASKDEVESRVQLLQTSILIQRIKDNPLKRQYEMQKNRKYRKFFTISMLFLAAIIFAQTLLTLIIRGPLEISAVFIAIRAGFSAYLVLLVLLGPLFTKVEWAERLLLFIGLLYGCVMVIYQSYNSGIEDDWFHRVAFLELTVILVIGLTSR